MHAQPHLRRGLFWLGSASAASRVLDALTLVVLLWFLSREEMGLATLAWTFTVFVEAFNGLGLHPALVQGEEPSEHELDSAFWYVVGIALALTAIVALAAPWLAAFYGDAALVPMIRVSATKLVFVGAALVPLALLSRAMRFREVAAVTTSATVLGSILTVALAAAGFGAWAPLLGNTAHGVFQLAGVLVVGFRRPGLRFSWVAIRARAAFGAKACVAGAIHELYRNVDYLIIGRVLGLGALGVYRVAFDLAMAPAVAIVQVASRTALPVYARLSETGDDLRAAFAWTLRSLGLLLAPIVVVLAFGGGELLAWIGGERWEGAVAPLSVLAWVALLRSYGRLYPQLFYARGRPGLAVAESVFSLVCLSGGLGFALVAFGERLGVMAACWAWLACAPVMLAFGASLASRVVPMTLGAYLRALRDPALGIALLAAVGALASRATAGLAEHGLAFALVAGATLVAYGGFLRLALGITPRALIGESRSAAPER